MPNKNRYECLLPEQKLTNSNCLDLTSSADFPGETIDLPYDAVVNMKDIKKLDLPFSDQKEVSLKDTSPPSQLRGIAKLRGLTSGQSVNF